MTDPEKANATEHVSLNPSHTEIVQLTTTSNSQRLAHAELTARSIEVAGRKTRESEGEDQEDEHQADVCSESGDHVQEAE